MPTRLRASVRAILGLSILAGLHGCASPDLSGKIKLNTLITDRGIKLFEMTYPGATKDPMRLSFRPKNKPWSEKKVLSYLNEALEQSGYCRQGFVILGRHAGETTHKVRGECKDTARPGDQERFPDSIQRW